MNKNMIDPNRIYHNLYYLDDYDIDISDQDPCELCDLSIQCDRISDELNLIEYCLCIDGIKDKEYKEKYPDAYFKKIDQNNLDK